MEEGPIKKIFRNDVLEKKAEANFDIMTAQAMAKDPLWATKMSKYQLGDAVPVQGPQGNIVMATVEKSLAGIYWLTYMDPAGKIFPLVVAEKDIDSFN